MRQAFNERIGYVMPYYKENAWWASPCNDLPEVVEKAVPTQKAEMLGQVKALGQNEKRLVTMREFEAIAERCVKDSL